MSEPKDFAKLSPEELMQIAQIPLKDDKLKDLPPVQRFIISDGLEQGDYKVPAAIIYNRYLHWCKAYNLAPLSVVKFFQDFAKHFNKARIPGGNAYIISPKGFDLSPQNLIASNSQTKRTSNGKKSKKQEKIQS